MIRFLLPLALACACSSDDPQPRPKVRGPGEPRRVLIDRIFITYRGNPAGVDARRDLDEARRLARRLLKRARAGEDFAQLRDGYSDDRAKGAEKANGPYILMNYGEKIAPTQSSSGSRTRTSFAESQARSVTPLCWPRSRRPRRVAR